MLFPEGGQLSNDLKRYSTKQRQLLLKTLAFLFGSENPSENSKSIKKVNNFKMLLEQRIFEDHILDNEFDGLMNLNSITLKLEIESLFANKKLPQLLDRIEYFKPQAINELSKILEVIVFIYDERRVYDQYESVLLKQLKQQVNNYFKIRNIDSDDIIGVLKNKIFENRNVSLESRLFLLSELWIEIRFNDQWQLGEKYVENKSLEYYREYLQLQEESGPWDFDDYTFYYIGNNLRKIENIRVAVIEATINFWSENNIELLCIQNTNIETRSMLSFKISDNIVEVFSSKDKFIDFVKKHKYSRKPEIVEFIKFFNLFQLTEYRNMILYTFKVSKLMKLKVTRRKSDPQYNREKYKDNKQLFFLTNAFQIKANIGLNEYKFKQENYAGIQVYRENELLTVYLMIYNNYDRDEIEGFVDFLIEKIEKYTNINEISFKQKDIWFNKNLLPEDSGYYLKLISEQPKE